MDSLKGLIRERKKYFVVPFVIVLLVVAYWILRIRDNPQDFIYKFF